MNFGDEYCAELPPGIDPEQLSGQELSRLFADAKCITRFHASPGNSFTQDFSLSAIGNSRCYKIDEDSLIEINDYFNRSNIVIHNEVSDLISFQFVSTVKRSEFLGDRKNVHDLGPAIIVSAIPNREATYRLPKTNEPIRHVMIYTTLSNLMQRMGESKHEYPAWLTDILDGKFDKPRQRVLFLEGAHRDLTWSCFHLPVSNNLLGHWMSAKFDELLCIGMQVLKNNRDAGHFDPVSLPHPREDKIRKAMRILNREYANPPTLPALARNLGISETQLKSGFKSFCGTTVLQYCIDKRMEAAKLLLIENKHSISEICDIVGYQDHSAFCRAFRQRSGCSPQQWRQSGRV